ncbi:Annexin [Penicillium brevicompactum]|uniref:Annexin n=1 Tax=Penicillium brevicompactum TaxID=5074 RepID=A0A9W9QF87_PENBR|nr:Annexin [Penicillium brevicompactum]
MSLSVNDPRSRRSKSPGRERSRSRDSRVPSPSPAPAPQPPDEEAEIERQYKLITDHRNATTEPRTISRAPRSPARYDVNRSSSDEDRRRADRNERSRRREDRYDHSDDDRARRQYVSAPAPPVSAQIPSSTRHRRRSPDRGSRVDDSDSSVDDELAYGDAPGAHPSYARPSKFNYAKPAPMAPVQPPRPTQSQPYPGAGTDWAAVPECERPGFVPPSSHADTASMPGAFPPASGFAEASGVPAQFVTPVAPYVSGAGYAPSHYRTASASEAGYPTTSGASGYANPGVFQYAQVDPNFKYTSKGAAKPAYTASAHEQFSRTAPQPAQPQAQAQYRQPMQQVQPQPHAQSQPQQQQDTYRYNYEPQVVEIAPGRGHSGGRPHSHSVSSNSLAVAGPTPSHAGHPPASPLLEPYHGTYQSISPMPSPIVIPSIRDEDISDLEPLDGGTSTSDSSRHRRHRSHSSVGEKDHRSSKDRKDRKDKERGSGDERRRPAHSRLDSSSSIADSTVVISPTTGRKRVSFYDAAADATAMQEALNHRTIDNKPLIQILPRLTSDEILTLRREYKSRVRMQGKGINLAKHLRLKLGSSNFAKVCYATALGRWESEAYWANCYYQAGTSRRELLIESLMGRSNAAIREIKSSFRDTRYDNSLERCMRAELRADKFRTAILLALEGGRQDDRDPVDKRMVMHDVQDLNHSLVRGGETAMIEIIVLRSDEHLREVLRVYEDMYRHNFAKAMIQKSQNLVGETLAHILNGAINRPMRDALLLHQALRESRSGRERSELLISRLVRLHWEPRHLALVKTEYRRRYRERLEEAIAEEILSLNGGHEWGEFCIELARSA